jgi:hypothetical protein
MPPEESSENPVHAVLNAAGVPWQLPRALLVQRYAILPHAAYNWDVIEIDTPHPILKGLLWPLSAQAFPQFSPRMPATQFSGIAYRTKDARENLRFAAEQLTPVLGKPENSDCANTLGLRYQFGCAGLSLTIWPPELQRFPMNNPAHERDPRLKTGCHLAIQTGFRQAPTAQEIDWLESFEPITLLQTGQLTAASALDRPAPPNELEFVRHPDPEFRNVFGYIGCSADRAALIFFTAQLYLIPLEDVIAFYVRRIRRAKGPGGAYLEMQCGTGYAAFPKKALTITSAPGVEDLNDLASKLARAMGKPFELGDYEYDT